MFIGQIVFIAVTFYLVYSKIFLPVFAEEQKMLQVIALLFAAVTMFAGNKLFKSKLQQIQDDTNAAAKERLLQYRTISILQWALVEAPCLLCGICLLLTGNYAFLALGLVIMLYFGMLLPVKSRVAAQLGLSISELDEL